MPLLLQKGGEGGECEFGKGKRIVKVLGMGVWGVGGGGN